MGMHARQRSDLSFGHKLMGGLQSAAKVAGGLKLAYDVGRTAYSVGSAMAPLATALLL